MIKDVPVDDAFATYIKNKKQTIFTKLFQIKNNWNNVLYIHTPFCPRKCKFCVYVSRADFTRKQFDDFYYKILPDQIKAYGQVLQKVKFNEVYFGGGTPTIANADMLKNIYDQIPRFEDIPIKITEASPYTIRDKHIQLFQKYKFSYVSLGIQSLSKRILTKNNSFCVSKTRLKNICEAFEKTNIIYNFDLICYLDKGDERDVPQFREDLKYIMSVLRPVSITIHPNYIVKRSVEKTRLLISLIRELVEIYPEYKCMNGLLQLKDVRRDMRFRAEYRLMRKRTDFFHYMWWKYPTMPPYGYNIISLGSYDRFNIFLKSNIGPCHFNPRTNRIFVMHPPLLLGSACDLIKKKLGFLRQINKNFSPYKRERKKFINLLNSALLGTDGIFSAKAVFK